MKRWNLAEAAERAKSAPAEAFLIDPEAAIASGLCCTKAMACLDEALAIPSAADSLLDALDWFKRRLMATTNASLAARTREPLDTAEETRESRRWWSLELKPEIPREGACITAERFRRRRFEGLKFAAKVRMER